MPFYPTRYYIFRCDDCNKIANWNSTKQARENGWAISKDYKKCYCKNCAPKHRNTGRNGVKRLTRLKKEIKK